MLRNPPQDGWLRRVLEDCRARSFVHTLAGRRRYLPNITSADGAARAAAERAAVNSAVQGSGADLCKAAMLALHARLPAAFPGQPKACRLVLQVGLLRGFVEASTFHWHAGPC